MKLSIKLIAAGLICFCSQSALSQEGTYLTLNLSGSYQSDRVSVTLRARSDLPGTLERIRMSGVVYYQNAAGNRRRVDDITIEFGNVLFFDLQAHSERFARGEITEQESRTIISNEMSEKDVSKRQRISNTHIIDNSAIMRNSDAKVVLEIMSVSRCRVSGQEFGSECMRFLNGRSDGAFSITINN